MEITSIIKKIDLVMWTLNAERTLPICLCSIEKSIPNKYIHNKIIVDGGSVDGTRSIAERHNWKVFDCEKGIGRQANFALSLVETEIFASFEADICLNKNWFNEIHQTLKKDVVVSQGVRFAINPTLKAIEEYDLKNSGAYSSIDNNLYNTRAIRKIGGFSEKHPYSSDRELQDRVRASGFKWLVNKHVVSIHLITSFRDRVKHLDRVARLNDYPTHNNKSLQFRRLTFSPIRGLQIVLTTKYPLAFFAYPYWRAFRLRSALKAGFANA